MLVSDRVRACDFGLGPGLGFEVRPVYNSDLAALSVYEDKASSKTLLMIQATNIGTQFHCIKATDHAQFLRSLEKLN